MRNPGPKANLRFGAGFPRAQPSGGFKVFFDLQGDDVDIACGKPL
jgi:hypothetical protein